MLSKFSVKKPFTVVVAVIMVFILGAVSFMNMTTDLLPNIELPYVVVSTTYAGASPEKVESSVTKPMESALSTLSGVKSVSSISSENASIVMLEFEQGTNMDSASIEISNRLDQVKAKFDDGVGSPTMMRISPDMMPVMVASVDAGGKSVEEVTKLVNDTVLPALQRVDGVGSVTASGLVEQQLKITLDQGKIDELNDRVLQAVDTQYDVIQVDAYQDITIPFQMSSVEFFTMVKDHLKDGGVMVVNMNMHGNKEGDINQYLADTIANVFDNVYSVDVAGSTNRELFASQHSDMIEVLSDHVENLSDAGLQNMMRRVADNSVAYATGDYLMTDDKAPVELLGMQVIDQLIQEEVAYYKDIYEEQGISGLLEHL